MENYELNFLLPASLKGEEVQQTASKIESFLQKENGLMVLGRRNREVFLGCSVKENKKATMVSLKFQTEPRSMSFINGCMKEIPEALRFDISKELKPRTMKESARRRPMIKKMAIAETTEEKKVDLKKIEEKIDEILG